MSVNPNEATVLAMIEQVLGTDNTWRFQSGWCQLFRNAEWVALDQSNTPILVVPPSSSKPNTKGAKKAPPPPPKLSIPSATLYDISEAKVLIQRRHGGEGGVHVSLNLNSGLENPLLDTLLRSGFHQSLSLVQQTNNYNYDVWATGDRITTKQLNLAHPLVTQYRALQQGRRLFLSPDHGPLPALKAFRQVVNNHNNDHRAPEQPKLLRPTTNLDRVIRVVGNRKGNTPWELMVNAETLKLLLEYLVKINQLGGYAVCDICVDSSSQSHNGAWFAVQNLCLLGPIQTRVPIHNRPVAAPLHHRIQRVGRQAVFQNVGGGAMVGVLVVVKGAPRSGTAHPPPLPCCARFQTTTPIGSYTVHSKSKLAIACTTQEWQINVKRGTIDFTRHEHSVLVQRPLVHLVCSLSYAASSSSTNKREPPEWVPLANYSKFNPSDAQKKECARIAKNAISPTNPWAILGANLERPADQNNKEVVVRVKGPFRFQFHKLMDEQEQPQGVESKENKDSKNRLLKPVLCAVGQHHGRWNTVDTVYGLRIMLCLDGTLYWLDTMKRLSEKEENGGYHQRIGYLQIQDDSVPTAYPVGAAPVPSSSTTSPAVAVAIPNPNDDDDEDDIPVAMVPCVPIE